MPAITSTGIGSGLDVNSIVTQLMALESRPLNLLQQAKTDLDAQFSAVGKLQSLTSTMRDAANSLSSVLLWNQTTAASGDATAVGVAAASGATLGSYSVQVANLAASQTVSSRAFAGRTTALSAGTLTIELGAWTGDPSPTGFAPKSGASAVGVTIGAGDSLEAIRDKINAAHAGVNATLVNDAGGTRLALRSTDTGAENAFRVTAAEDSDDGDAATGLSTLGFDAVGPTQMVRNQRALNAAATINGIAVTSASNKLDGVADGLTLTLIKPTTTAVDVTVKPADDAVKSAVTTFTTAFNDLANNIRDLTKYDPATKKGGTLQGDRTAIGLVSQLRAVLNQPSTASSTYSQLADVGITMSKTGTLTVDDTKLAAAIANRDELRKVFAADASTSGASGFMDRFRDLGNALLGTAGALTTRSDGLQSSITRNQKQQDTTQTRLDQTEKRLRAQYQALDTNMSKLSNLSSYLTGQLAALNK